jgi:hypothetical protein
MQLCVPSSILNACTAILDSTVFGAQFIKRKKKVLNCGQSQKSLIKWFLTILLFLIPLSDHLKLEF